MIGIAFSLVFAIVVMNARKPGLRKHWADLVIIMFTGLYGLIAVTIIEPEP